MIFAIIVKFILVSKKLRSAIKSVSFNKFSSKMDYYTNMLK
jgi:hypothetical protein